MNFVQHLKSNGKVKFIGKLMFFYIILMILWFTFLLSGDSDAPTFIYEQF